MNGEKVKEIKESLQRKIIRAENVDDDLVNCVSVIALKEYLTLINELESENEKLLDSVETVQSNRCTTKCELTKRARNLKGV